MDRFIPSDESLVVVAQDYHGGQGSMLYALGSTGALTPGRPGVALADLLSDLEREVRHAILDAENLLGAVDSDRVMADLAALDMLQAEVTAALAALTPQEAL